MIDVLVIEDDHIVREQIVETLEGEGYAVAEAEGIADALAVLRAGGARLLVADMQLEGGLAREDGHRLAQRLAEADPELAVLFISGDRAALAAQPLAARHRALPKPFAPRELVSEIRALLD
jgi:two-component system, OmpR family, response regulator